MGLSFIGLKENYKSANSSCIILISTCFRFFGKMKKMLMQNDENDIK